MSKFMLSDEDAINDVNPFVTQEFSLPGSVRQSGRFDDFSKSTGESVQNDPEESVYCSFALCETQAEPTISFSAIHHRRNIDTGFTCDTVKVGVAKQNQFPYVAAIILSLFIALALSYVRR